MTKKLKFNLMTLGFNGQNFQVPPKTLNRVATVIVRDKNTRRRLERKRVVILILSISHHFYKKRSPAKPRKRNECYLLISGAIEKRRRTIRQSRPGMEKYFRLLISPKKVFLSVNFQFYSSCINSSFWELRSLGCLIVTLRSETLLYMSTHHCRVRYIQHGS